VTVGAARRRLQHDGIFYDDESVFAKAAVSFVREGIDRDEVVLVNTGRNLVTALLKAMFRSDEQVVFAGRAVYSTPAAALDGYERTMARGLAAGAQGFRAMGFIDLERSLLPWQEWLRYEAAVNRVFADHPLQTLCPYDVTEVEPSAIDAIVRAHPGLVDASGRHPNPAYTEPAALMADARSATPPHPLEDSAPRMVLAPGEDVAELRVELYAATLFTDLPRRKLDDFVKAVSELVHNAHRHGRPPVTLRLWASDTAVICTVSDHGPGVGDPFLGYARPTDPAQGLGMWGARQLVDVLDFEHDGGTFTVRAASFG
jgi:anti-sigma regulatory factor (Ser/Thr protein kinase)